MTREELAEWLQRHYSRSQSFPWEKLSAASKKRWLQDADAVLAHLGEGREQRLPEGAFEAIFAEHQRDHDDGPKWPREGCTGCAMLADNAALRARLDEAIVQMRDYTTVQEDRNRWCEKVGALQAEARAQAAAHAEDVRKIQTTIVVKDDLIARMRNLLVDAIYLMPNFGEDDAAYKGWHEKSRALLADTDGR